ncbi:MAG: preprotein translocase subunit SecA [bacterium]|nr:preprotein translocase subunit SecA [bacterium]
MSILSKIFGDANEKYAKSVKPIVDRINLLEPDFQKLSDEELKSKTSEFKERILKGETLDDLLPEAYAVVREAARRKLGQRHFDVQLIGGMVLHQGKIAEMKTGEGKTLVATLPLYLNSLSGRGVHLVTPNDYLSRVGAGWMGPVYHALGEYVAVITHDFSGIFDPAYEDPKSHGDDRLNHFRPCGRKEAYLADITYGTNNEFGFDYLRDNLEYLPDSLRQRDFNYAIVDEIDSILIDEARTPLIISAPDAESADLYKTFAQITPQLKENADYNVDEKFKSVSITEAGIDKVEKILGVGNIYEEKGMRFVRHLEQALRAQALFRRDKDYVVKNGEVIIVDEFTGRLMPGRRWSEGLHQAVEAKEGVEVQKESRTLATITFQNYFRMYKKLSGMTGTAQTSAEEFHKVYGLEVVTIPTHRPMVRDDQADLIFRTEKGKIQAVAREIKERNEKGQPVLVGTVSIEKNEHLSQLLKVEGVPHQILNAKNHEQEAMIIAQAGRKGAVTIATNMAGRGVDIILGGSPPDPIEAAEVKKLGGLRVLGTGRHEARRIDNQLRGRAGRQGDPGASQFFVSLEDDLMRVFGSDRIKRMMESFGIPEDQSIENRIVSRAIESAQSKIEGFHFDSRKHVLEYDDVLSKQRETIYHMRREILFANQTINKESVISNKDRILEMLKEFIENLVNFHTSDARTEEWNLEEISENIKAVSGTEEEIHAKLREITGEKSTTEYIRTALAEYLFGLIIKLYDTKEKTTGNEGIRNIEKVVLLNSIDTLWMDHLDQMEHLRDSVRLRAYGQRDPLVEYKNEGIKLFRELQGAIRAQVVNNIFKVGGAPRQENFSHAREVRPEVASLMPQKVENFQSPNAVASGKKEPHRNDPCHCGSGKKFKRCHGA